MRNRLNNISQLSFDSLTELNREFQKNKEKLVKLNKQQKAKEIWICQRIIEIHQLYRNAFKLLKAFLGRNSINKKDYIRPSYCAVRSRYAFFFNNFFCFSYSGRVNKLYVNLIDNYFFFYRVPGCSFFVGYNRPFSSQKLVK